MSSEENIWSDVEIDFGDGEIAVVEKEKINVMTIDATQQSLTRLMDEEKNIQMMKTKIQKTNLNQEIQYQQMY